MARAAAAQHLQAQRARQLGQVELLRAAPVVRAAQF
jgi:hypothetical protein